MNKKLEHVQKKFHCSHPFSRQTSLQVVTQRYHLNIYHFINSLTYIWYISEWILYIFVSCITIYNFSFHYVPDVKSSTIEAGWLEKTKIPITTTTWWPQPISVTLPICIKDLTQRAAIKVNPPSWATLALAHLFNHWIKFYY